MSCGEAFVVIHREYVIAIARHPGSRIGLAGRRSHHGQQRIGAHHVIAFHMKVGNQRLRALHDAVRNGESPLFTLIVVVQRRSNLHIQKAVGKIKSAYGIGIVVHQLLAEPSVRSKGSGLQLQPAFQQTFAEILVPGETDTGKAEFIAADDFVANHALPARGVLVRAHLHVRVEIPLPLKIIADITPAFLQ